MSECIACGAPENQGVTPMGRVHVWCGNNNCPRHQNVNEEYTEAFKLAKPWTLLSYAQGFTLWRLAHVMPNGTAMAELGVYKGGGAMLMRAGNPEAPLYLFDTFTGHPDNDRSKDRPGTHPPGSLGDTSADDVLLRMQPHWSERGNVSAWPGYFPRTLDEYDGSGISVAQMMQRQSLGLVHIDVDIYESVKAGLVRLAPLVAPGGSIVLDDWCTHDCPGVVTAFDEWWNGGGCHDDTQDEWRLNEEAYPTYQLVMTKRRTNS